MTDPTWALVQYTTAGGADARVGVSAADGIHAAPQGWPASIAALLDEWRALEDELRALDPSALPLVDGATLIAPITYPRKVICAGANYYDHAAEMGTAVPDPHATPFFFLKPPTTTIVGSGAEIEMPRSTSADVDWEAELGVVIADRVKEISAEEALDHVAGYLNANDISARGLFPRTDPVAAPFAFDWIGHKGLDGFCPIGPGLVPQWLIEDVNDLDITLTVNDVVKQQSNTKNLVASVAALISAASQLVTLEPGDIILTGTPAGVGMPRKEFLSAGDVLTVEIAGLGRLVNTMVPAATKAQE
ncbi:fumarylacetoacetate hydrolase family protein [Microbacterium sp. ARD31]|uniref:fumarylacetoacetate hydrolase family protein n=1 Tax=Microbacterium sp. ARD31 TaxID=2962576 RepID=UPI0028822AC8|nr:fumarylacetoacetate hydrolase family protein [Microbacterium sp. ARD31]MDT0183953.1 fumarylacetoacetate hydrolase family protein [Microbacterium sp. ARD31]